MVDSRQKGKRGERYVADKIRHLFPRVSRNWAEQAAQGGIDLINTGRFDIECKCGEQVKIKKVFGWLEQVRAEGHPDNYKIVWCKPDRCGGYIIMPEEDFLEMLETYVQETA